MNVTKRNFDKVAEKIEALLPTAAFVAIDEEMTGICGHHEMRDVESAEDRYTNMRDVASRYNITEAERY